MSPGFFTRLRRFTAAWLVALLAPGAAQAGLVTGIWDPSFGAFLPGLSWAVRSELLVPNGCSNQADGVYSTASGPCDTANITVQNVFLRLYDTGLGDPNDFFGFPGGFPPVSAYWDMQHSPSIGYGITKVRVLGHQVVGFEAGRLDLVPALVLTPAYAQTVVCGPSCVSFPATAEGNLFGLTFSVDGPVLDCHNCRAHFADPYGTSSVYGSTDQLQQFLVTYDSNDTSAPRFTDGSGNALGARLNGAGSYLGQSNSVTGQLVTEPGVLMLVLTALAAAAGASRRRHG